MIGADGVVAYGANLFSEALKTNDRPAVVRIAPFATISLKPLLASRPLPKSVNPGCYLSEESRRCKSGAPEILCLPSNFAWRLLIALAQSRHVALHWTLSLLSHPRPGAKPSSATATSSAPKSAYLDGGVYDRNTCLEAK